VVPPVRYQGDWLWIHEPRQWRGGAHVTATAGSTVTLRSAASDLAIVATVGPDRGRFRVDVDGAPGRVIDLYAPTLGYRRVVWTQHFESPGPHRLRIVVLGEQGDLSTGATVEIDAIAALR
jgi:hypothetical protein